jgi:hypothetical protein
MYKNVLAIYHPFISNLDKSQYTPVPQEPQYKKGQYNKGPDSMSRWQDFSGTFFMLGF